MEQKGKVQLEGTRGTSEGGLRGTSRTRLSLLVPTGSNAQMPIQCSCPAVVLR